VLSLGLLTFFFFLREEARGEKSWRPTDGLGSGETWGTEKGDTDSEIGIWRNPWRAGAWNATAGAVDEGIPVVVLAAVWAHDVR